ncbi:hypothetical protein AB0P05_35855 [Streptomyces flaveolus]
MADGTSACSHYRPDTGLGIADRGRRAAGLTPVTAHGQRSPWPSAGPRAHGPFTRP